MRKSALRTWHKTWVIVPAIMIPPLGFLLLWTSPRSVRVKVSATLLALMLWSAAVAAFLTTDAYNRLVGSGGTDELYDVTMDKYGRYHTSRILPFECEIFRAVVVDLRHRRKQQLLTAEEEKEEVTLDSALPETQTFETVANPFGLPLEDVQAIYFKVSSQIGKKQR